MIKLLNNTLSPSFIVRSNYKTFLVNCPKGYFKNLSEKVNAVIITSEDKYHIHDLDKIKEDTPIYILKEFEFNIKRIFPKINFDFRYIKPYKKFEGITPIQLHKDEKSSLGLIIDDLTILPSFWHLTEKTKGLLTKNVLLSAKYLEENERKDYTSIEYIRKTFKDIDIKQMGFIGLSKELKDKFSDTYLKIGENNLKSNKNNASKIFLYLCKEALMKKTFYSQNLKFDCITAIKSEKSAKDFYIIGYASTPTVDRQDEIITAQALKAAEGDLLKPQNSTLFLNHNYDKPIGKITEVKYTDAGLLIKVLISETEPKIRKQIEEGLWTSFSIGGIIKEIEQVHDKELNRDIVKITSIELVEVSLVGVPANPEANLISVLSKSLTDVKIDRKELTEKTRTSTLKELKLKGKEFETKRIDFTKFDTIENFLGSVSHEQKVLTASYSYFKLALMSKSLTEVAKELNYKITKTINLDYYGQLTRPEYMNLSVSRSEKEELLVEGLMFLQNDKNEKLILSISPGWNSFSINVYSNAKSGDLAKNFQDTYITWSKENNFFKGEKINPQGEFLSLPDISFEDLKIVADKKKSIEVGALEFFNKKDIYKKNSLPFKRGLIFAGEPGTGKTMTGKVLVANTKSTFIWVTAGDLSDGYGGIDTEAFKRMLKMAKELSPCILFAEDVDDYLASSGAVDTIKTQMDGLDSMDGVVTILCTNYAERIPKSLIDRPSRFDDVIMFDLPDEILRYEILEAHTKAIEITDREVNLKEIAKESEGLTGAHLKEIAIYSLLLAADDSREIIENKDLITALNKVKKTRELIADLEGKKQYVNKIRTSNLKETLIKEMSMAKEKLKEETLEPKEEIKDKELETDVEKALEKARGDGQGNGGDRQGDGGADICVCPDCSKEVTHTKGTPCNETKCPDCGTPMVGKALDKEVEEKKEEVKEEKVEIKEEKIEEKKEEEIVEEFNLETSIKSILTRLDSLEAIVKEFTSKSNKEPDIEEPIEKELKVEAKEELKVPDNTEKEEKVERKGIVEDNKLDTEEEKLLAKISGMSITEIMNDAEIWKEIPKQMQEEMKKNYFTKMVL